MLEQESHQSGQDRSPRYLQWAHSLVRRPYPSIFLLNVTCLQCLHYQPVLPLVAPPNLPHPLLGIPSVAQIKTKHASAASSDPNVGEYSNLCKTLDWGIGALRENHLNHTTGRHCSMCNCGLRNTETTLVSNIQLCSVSSLPKAACFTSERDLAPYLALSRGESCHCTVTWVEGVAIKFLPAIGETSCAIH